MYHWNSAESVPPVSAWRDTFVGLHGASRITVADDGPWTGRLEWQQSQAYSIALCGGIQEDFNRDTRHIRADPRGTYELLVPVTGAARVAQGPSSGEMDQAGQCELGRTLDRTDHLLLRIRQSCVVQHRIPARIRHNPS